MPTLKPSLPPRFMLIRLAVLSAHSSATPQLAPFDTSLGTLTSVDLTLAAVYQEAFFWLPEKVLDGTDTVSGTYTGTSSFSVMQSTNTVLAPYGAGPGCPNCTILASLSFGGEQTFTGSDLSQFENGMVPVSATGSAAFSTSQIPAIGGILCCITDNEYGLTITPYPQFPFYTVPVTGYLSLDVSATYTYTPIDPVDPAPEPTTWLSLLFALSIMTAVSRWRKPPAMLTRAAAPPSDRFSWHAWPGPGSPRLRRPAGRTPSRRR